VSALAWAAAGFASVGALGAYVRWAAAGVILAFRAGAVMGRRQGLRDREILIRTIAAVTAERDELAARTG